MAKGKKGGKKTGGKGGQDKARPPEIRTGTPFVASTLLTGVPGPAGAKKAKGAKGKKAAQSSSGDALKTAYSAWDSELFVGSAANLAAGGMIMVEEEAVQVLEVCEAKGKKDDKVDKAGVKLVVRRACMGTTPKPHAFDAPVLALPPMVSHRPGTSPAPVRVRLDLMARAHSSGGDEEKAEKAEDVHEVAALPPSRITKWFEQNRQDLVFGLQPRRMYIEAKAGAQQEKSTDQSTSKGDAIDGTVHTRDNLRSCTRLATGWRPVFPYSTPIPDVLVRNFENGGSANASRAPALQTQESMIPKEQMLMYAVKHGHIETVDQLLLEGLKPNMLCKEAKSKFRPKATMLMLAAQDGHAHVAKLLIAHQADVLLQAENETALSIARRGLESVRHLLEKKIKEHAVAEERKRKEEEAAEAKQKEEAEVRLQRLGSFASMGSRSVLSRSNSAALLRSNSGGIPGKSDGTTEEEEGKEEHTEQRRPVGSEERAKIDGFEETIAILRQEYVSIVRRGRLLQGSSDSQNFHNDKILRLGIEEGWPDLVEAVIVDGGMSPNHIFSIANPGTKSWTSASAVQLAATLGDAQVLKVLLQQRANARVIDVDGCTPLMYAARSGTAESAKLLLEAGARLELMGPTGTAAHEAVCHSNAGVLAVLLKAGARVGDKHDDGQDSVMRAWTMARGAASSGREGAAGATLEVFRSLFQQLAEMGRQETCDAYCYVALGLSVSGPWYPGVRSKTCQSSTSPSWNENLELLHPGNEVPLSAMAVKIEVWDWDQVGDELLIGSMTQSLHTVVSQPNSTLAGAFNITSSIDGNVPSPKSQKSPVFPAASTPTTTASSPMRARGELFRGLLNIKLQALTNSLAVHLKNAEHLEPQDRKAKQVADCLKASSLAGWCDIIAICASKDGDFNTNLDGGRRRCALMYAAATQQVQVLKVLLAKGSSAGSCPRGGLKGGQLERDGSADLSAACDANDDLHSAANPNQADSDGVTALMWACAGRIIVPRNAKMTSDEEAALDGSERRLCQLRIGYGAAQYIPEGGSHMDISIRSTYEAREKKTAHDKLFKQLQAQYPDVILARHRTVDVLLLAGANPLQQDRNGCDATHYLKPDMDHATFLTVEWLWR